MRVHVFVHGLWAPCSLLMTYSSVEIAYEIAKESACPLRRQYCTWRPEDEREGKVCIFMKIMTRNQKTRCYSSPSVTHKCVT